MPWAANCGASEPSNVVDQLRSEKVRRCGSRSEVNCSKSLTMVSIAENPAVIFSRISRQSASPSIRRRKTLRYKVTGTRLLRTSWATWAAICPRSASRFFRASSRFFASSSSVSRRTSSRSA